MQVTWAGIPEVMDAFLTIVAGAADIPMTRLLGQSPKGLQSTGDGEERDYQLDDPGPAGRTAGPALDRIDELLIPSALGSRPSDVYYEFAPLRQMDEKDAAEIEASAPPRSRPMPTPACCPIPRFAMAKNGIVESGRWPGSEAAFEDAEAAGADPLDPEQSTTLPISLTRSSSGGARWTKQGTVTPAQADALITDARRARSTSAASC
jgi:hypothetical protein